MVAAALRQRLHIRIGCERADGLEGLQLSLARARGQEEGPGGGGRDILVSAEYFSRMTELEFQALKEGVEEGFDEVHFIVVLRSSVGKWIISFYNQVTQGFMKRSQGFPEYLLETAEKKSRTGPGGLPCVVPAGAQCLKFLAGLVGGQRVHALHYEGMEAAGVSLQDALACRIVTPPLPCTAGRMGGNHKPKRLNKSSAFRTNQAEAMIRRAATLWGCEWRRFKDAHRLAEQAAGGPLAPFYKGCRYGHAEVAASAMLRTACITPEEAEAMAGEGSVKAYYFDQGGLGAKSAPQQPRRHARKGSASDGDGNDCILDVSAVLQIPEAMHGMARMMKRLAGCVPPASFISPPLVGRGEAEAARPTHLSNPAAA